MKLGMIVRQDNTGLGIQSWEAYRHLSPDRVMVVDMSQYKLLKQYPGRFGEPFMRVRAMPSLEQVQAFLKGLDAVFTCETPYSYYLLKRAHERRIRTIIQPNYEFAPWIQRNSVPRPDVFAVPSTWHYDDFPGLKMLLPVPIAVDRFQIQPSLQARKFLHIAGLPAAHDRNGTVLLIKALAHVQSQIRLEIFTQARNYVEPILTAYSVPRNVQVVVNRMQPDNYWEMYCGQDVLLMPRRYGGLSLPVNEAVGAGIPVIMPAVVPNCDWLPKDWLVPATDMFTFKLGRWGNPVEVADVDPVEYAARIDRLASDPVFYRRCLDQAVILRERYSWQSLRELYLQTITNMIAA
jgi:glycosyltransferase involved in cell wall biosynthesis